MILLSDHASPATACATTEVSRSDTFLLRDEHAGAMTRRVLTVDFRVETPRPRPEGVADPLVGEQVLAVEDESPPLGEPALVGHLLGEQFPVGRPRVSVGVVEDEVAAGRDEVVEISYRPLAISDVGQRRVAVDEVEPSVDGWIGQRRDAERDVVEARLGRSLAVLGDDRLGGVVTAEFGVEIGRASCRERVSLYV